MASGKVASDGWRGISEFETKEFIQLVARFGCEVVVVVVVVVIEKLIREV